DGVERHDSVTSTIVPHRAEGAPAPIDECLEIEVGDDLGRYPVLAPDVVEIVHVGVDVVVEDDTHLRRLDFPFPLEREDLRISGRQVSSRTRRPHPRPAEWPPVSP